jgi:transcriptional regulator with XRE-family HTH domain
VSEDAVDEILKRYSLQRDTARRYIEAATMGNGKEAAEQVGVSRRTISNYKNGFAAMTETERAVVLFNLMKEHHDELVDEKLAEQN